MTPLPKDRSRKLPSAPPRTSAPPTRPSRDNVVAEERRNQASPVMIAPVRWQVSPETERDPEVVEQPEVDDETVDRVTVLQG
jgi:hypothetical protein